MEDPCKARGFLRVRLLIDTWVEFRFEKFKISAIVVGVLSR